MTNSLKTLTTVAAISLFSLTLTACSPEVGSPEWCEHMKMED
jgi:hypothetical protein